MSDYFGALLRMSGIAIGAGAPAAVARPPAPSIEAAIPAERSPPTEQHETRAQQPSRQPLGDTTGAAPIVPQNAEGAPTPVPAEASLMDAPFLRADRDRRAHPQAVTTVEPDGAPVPSPPRAAERTPSATDHRLGQALVRAAMRWVAADPQQATHPPERAIPRDPVPSIAAKTDGAVVGRSPHDTAVELDTGHPRAFPARQLEVAQASAPRPAIAAMPMASTAPPDVRDEVVDISIGAIHVRVDAPSPQTVAGTSPPAAASRPAAPAPARCGLSRRAMRRI